MYIVTSIFIVTVFSVCAEQGFPLQWRLDSSSSVWAGYNDETATLSVTLMTMNDTDHDRNAVLYREAESDRCRPLTSEPEENHTTFKHKRILKLPLTECPSNASHQMRARFFHVTDGRYCLSIYGGGRLLFNSETPITVANNPSQSHYIYWNPKLDIQPDDANDIRIDIRRSDSYDWHKFIVDLYRQSEYVEYCQEMIHVVQRNIVEIGREFSTTFRNLSSGWYCFSITPYEGSCASNHHPTDFPETEFSVATRLVAENEVLVIRHELTFFQSRYFIMVIVLVALIIVIDALYICSTKKPTIALGPSARDLDPEQAEKLIKSVLNSILLLYSTESDATISAIERFKLEFRQRFPWIQIDDCRDPEQWEAVSTQGISWLLCRIEKRNVCVVIVDSEDMDRSTWNVPTLRSLNQIASTTSLSYVDYRRVLVIKLANVPCSIRSPQLEAWTPFTRFTLPRDWNAVGQHFQF